MSHPFPPSAPSETSSKVWSYRRFGEHNFWRGGLLAWWYRWTAPADAPARASFAQRDLVRRGRIASAIMLFLAIMLVVVAAIGWFGPNKQIFYTALIVWATIGVCIVLNRRKHVNLVGVLICLSVNTGMYLSVLRAPGGVSLNEKDILYLLCFSELFIGAILPFPWIALPFSFNLLFSAYELYLAPHAPDLAALPQASLFTIMTRVFQIHVFIAGVLWVLNAHARATIARANQAEETARLHHDLGLDMALRQQQAEALRQATTELVQTLMQVMRGNLHARVATQQGAAFWTLGGMLNGLLNRYQRAMHDARDVQTLRLAVHQHQPSHQIAQRLTQEQARIQEAVAQALREQRPFALPEGVEILEPFFHPLQGYSLVPATAESAQSEASLTPNNVVAAKPPLSPVMSGPTSLPETTAPPLGRERSSLSSPASPLSSPPHQQGAVPTSLSLPSAPFNPTSKEVHDDPSYRQYL